MALAARVLGMLVFLTGIGLFLATPSRVLGLWICAGGVLVSLAGNLYAYLDHFRRRRRAIEERKAEEASRPPT